MAKLRHIAIAVPDLEAAAAFYENAFALERVKQTAKRIYLSDGTVNLTLLPSDDLAGDAREGFVGIHHIGFVTEDLAATAADIEANGGRPVKIPSGYVGAYAERKYWDPNGIMVDVSHSHWVGSK